MITFPVGLSGFLALQVSYPEGKSPQWRVAEYSDDPIAWQPIPEYLWEALLRFDDDRGRKREVPGLT